MKLGTKIAQLIGVDPDAYAVRLKYSDGEAVRVRLEHVFGHPTGLAAEVLRGGMFEMAFIENGALAWPNGLELCPDALRSIAEPLRRSSQRKK